MHAFGTDGRGDAWGSGLQGVEQFSFHARSESERGQAASVDLHGVQCVCGPAFNMESIFGVMELGGFGRGVGAVDMEFGLREFFTNPGPEVFVHPLNRIPVGWVTEISYADEMLSSGVVGPLAAVRQGQHEGEGIEEEGGDVIRSREDMEFLVGEDEREVGSVDAGHLPHSGVAEHVFTLKVPLFFQGLSTSEPKRVEIDGVEDADGVRTALCYAPAKLFLGHESIENHGIPGPGRAGDLQCWSH